MKNENSKQSGQVLLIIVLISAVLLTVGLSVTQIGTNNTKITKLEDDNKRALAAAEAGLEAQLRKSVDQSTSIADLLPKGSAITGTAQTSAIIRKDFVSPTIKKDTIYTFYMADYTDNTFSNFFNDDLQVYFQGGSSGIDGPGSGTGANPILEITFIRNDNSIERLVVDPNTPAIPKAELPTNVNTQLPDYGGVTFNYQYQISASVINSTKLLLVRVLNADSKIGLRSASNLPLQGKTVTSTAQTATGVTKKIELFQSYPQIPTDFFVTSF